MHTEYLWALKKFCFLKYFKTDQFTWWERKKKEKTERKWYFPCYKDIL